MEKKKVNHDHICDECGAPATVSYEKIRRKYDLTEDGDYIEDTGYELDYISDGGSELYCEKHDPYKE